MPNVIVSIILPVYNVEKYIDTCLTSLLNQTYDKLQIIIVDDGSTDESLNIVKSYKDKFNNIIILTQKNKGVSEARNLALKYVEGNYVLFIDSDDYINNTMIEKLLSSCLKFDSDIAMCGYYLYYENANKKNEIKLYDLKDNYIYDNKKIIDEMLLQKIQGHLWNKMFKKELLDKIKFIFEPGRYIQDMLPVFKAVCCSRKITYINEALYYYRQIETSTIHKNNFKLADDYYHATCSVINYINENGMFVKRESMDTFRTMSMLILILQLINADEYSNFRTFKNGRYKEIIIKNYLFNSNISIKNKIKITLIKLDVYKLLKNANRYISKFCS